MMIRLTRSASRRAAVQGRAKDILNDAAREAHAWLDQHLICDPLTRSQPISEPKKRVLYDILAIVILPFKDGRFSTAEAKVYLFSTEKVPALKGKVSNFQKNLISDELIRELFAAPANLIDLASIMSLKYDCIVRWLWQGRNYACRHCDRGQL